MGLIISELSVTPMTSSDIAEIVAAFAVFGWGGKDRAQYERYLHEQEAGVRDVLYVALQITICTTDQRR